MTFTLTINMDSVAFADDPHSPRFELGTCLRRAAFEIELAPNTTSLNVHDSIGNVVGRWEIR